MSKHFQHAISEETVSLLTAPGTAVECNANVNKEGFGSMLSSSPPPTHTIKKQKRPSHHRHHRSASTEISWFSLLQRGFSQDSNTANNNNNNSDRNRNRETPKQPPWNRTWNILFERKDAVMVRQKLTSHTKTVEALTKPCISTFFFLLPPPIILL